MYVFSHLLHNIKPYFPLPKSFSNTNIITSYTLSSIVIYLSGISGDFFSLSERVIEAVGKTGNSLPRGSPVLARQKLVPRPPLGRHSPVQTATCVLLSCSRFVMLLIFLGGFTLVEYFKDYWARVGLFLYD